MTERRVTVPGLPWCWGIRPEDLTLDYPCDGLLGGPVRSLYRAVDVTAWPELTYRWLCQMRVAPYSYDLLDNLGRRSPTTLTPGADELAVGTVMMVFHVTSFEPGVHITGVTTPKAARIFGRLAATYLVVPRRGGCSRIIVRLDVADASGLGCLRSRALAWGDLVMMRKQLLTLKSLAERDQAAVERVAPPMSASTPAGVEA